jgi:hypothetical protein
MERDDGTPAGVVDVVRVTLDLIQNIRLLVQLLHDRSDVQVL